MKAKAIPVAFLLCSMLLFFTPSVNATPVVFEWGGEQIVKVMDLPNTPSFQRADGSYADVGVRYKQVAIFFVPVWNYDVKWCGYIGSDKEYLDLDKDDLSELAEAASLKLPDTPSLPLWDSIGGKLVFGLVLALYFGYQAKKEE